MGWCHKFSVVIACAAMLLCAATAAAASPKAAFSARVRAIGTQAQQGIVAMPAPASPTTAETAANAAQLQAIYSRVARRLAALKPPPRIKADYKLLVASFQVAANYAGAWQDALLHGSAKEAADASGKVYLNPASVRASAALVRMSHEGYYFGTYYH